MSSTMASHSVSQAVKCLNKTPGGKRFVFKSFSQRVKEIDIDVYHSLDPVQSEPSKASSFFLDALFHWRELNTAEDFISFYEEMFPVVQTLPLVLLHKDMIFTKLLNRIQFKSRLSLEPLLGLVSALSRDILEEFIPFLRRLVDSLFVLIQNGGERDPEVLEQVFTYWSYIMMYLQKYLIGDVVKVLKDTRKLRYYPKDYVQVFMAESMSFLMRNAPVNQLKKGILKVVREASRKPSARKAGAGALLWHIMRGTSSTLHSRAKYVMELLFSCSILCIEGTSGLGSETILPVIDDAFQRLCMELGDCGLNVVWSCLLEAIRLSCGPNGCLIHVDYLLSIVISIVQYSSMNRNYDYKPVLEVVNFLVEKYIVSLAKVEPEDHSITVVNKILELMLSLLDIPCIFNNSSIMSMISHQWSPVFTLGSSSLIIFIKKLILKDSQMIYFLNQILRTMDCLIDSACEDVLFVLVTLDSRQVRLQTVNALVEIADVNVSRLGSFFDRTLCYWNQLMKSIIEEQGKSDRKVCNSELAVLWGTFRCYYLVQVKKEGSLLLMDIIDYLAQLCAVETERIAGLPRSIWQCMLGAALASYHRVLLGSDALFSELNRFLQIAKANRSSEHVLYSVAEFLDSVLGPTNELAASKRLPELDVDQTVDAIAIFSHNLSISSKLLRVSTLRILSHFAHLDCQLLADVERPYKKLKMESSACDDYSQSINVIKLLLSIESTPLTLNSREKINMISSIQSGLNFAKIHDAYLPLLTNSLIGIFHIRFRPLWEVTIQCLVDLMKGCKKVIWDIFFQCLVNCQSHFLEPNNQMEMLISEYCRTNDTALGNLFKLYLVSDAERTPCVTVLGLLLESLRHDPHIVESHSKQLIKLFLRFLGYADDDLVSVQKFSSHGCKTKEWAIVLTEWLDLLRLMSNSLLQNNFLKDVLSTRLLDEMDPNIQVKVLDCLLNWKDDFLLPYEQHIKNLINLKSLREELTTWSLSKDSCCIEEKHRAYVVPLVIRILVSKVKNIKLLSSKKHAGVNRKALLCYLAQLDDEELCLFFSLTFHPIFLNNHSAGNSHHSSEVVPSILETSPVQYGCSTTLVDNIPWRKRFGFLHVIEDVVKTFDESHLKPFLNTLMFVVVWILGSCSTGLQSAQGREICIKTAHSALETQCCTSAVSSSHEIPTVKQMKDIRALCLKIISYVIDKYHDHDFGTDFWKKFFFSIKPLTERLKQEVSSNEKPSSLLSCFLSMSRKPELISLLDHEGLLPIIFSILTVKTCSDVVTSSILVFINNLLNLAEDSDIKENSLIKAILLPNFDAILLSLQGLFKFRKENNRNSGCGPGKTETSILKKLASYVHGSSGARQFVDIMLPLFRKRTLSSDECLEGLHVIRRVVPDLDILAAEEFLNAVQPILVYAESSIRLCVCDILDDFAAIHPSLVPVAELFHELNATSSSELDELDYDTRIRAYNKIRPDLFFRLKCNQALILMSHCVYDISSEDLIVRQSASNSLISFIQFCAAITESCLETASADMSITSGAWTKSSIQRVINKILMQNMAEAMSKGASIQKEWMVLLREMILKLPGECELHLLSSLCGKDPEDDFFDNILHLQIHKRMNALSHFKNAINAGSFPEPLMVKIFVPLFCTMMFDVKAGKGEHLRNAFLDSLACISGQMQWKAYHHLLLRCFREMVLKPDKQKFLLRLICSILDNFHFYANDPDCVQVEHNIESQCEVLDSRNTMTNKMPYVCNEIEVKLRNTLLPRIMKLLDSDSESLNVNASLVALKVLKLLGRDTLEVHLPSIIHRISNFLKSRLESIRDEARSALVLCVKELGLVHLQDIIRVVMTTLKRGFELHVLGYTLNFLLGKCLIHPSVGILDYRLEDILSITFNDILGDVALEKEIDKIASKMKETSKRLSFETIKLVSQSISFKTHAIKLLSHVKTYLQKPVTATVKAKLKNILHSIASGIKCNPSADKEEVLIFVYGLINGVIVEDFKMNNISACESNKNFSHEVADGGNALDSFGHGLQSSHLILAFSLEVLNNCLKCMKLDKEDMQLLSMLDPFIKLLKLCLRSKYEDVLSATFKSLGVLIKLPLPAVDLYADEIKLLILDIAQKAPNTNSMLVQSCLKLLTVILSKISLSNDHLRMVIQFPLFIELQANPSPVALSLLKQIVSRKLAVPELYDVVSRVAELMVSSQSEPIRKKCSHILLKFLLDYPLSEKHRQQRLNFFLANLRYVHASGREAVLEMLNAILVKFPKREVDVHAQTIFLHLVVCLANEHDTKVASMVCVVIKQLLTRTSKTGIHRILEYTFSWYKGGKHHLWAAAAQVLALLVVTFKDELQDKVHELLQLAKDVLNACLGVFSCNKRESSYTSPFEKGAFYSLNMLEKLLLQFPDLYSDPIFEGLWDSTCKFLQHPYIQLQNISNQLLALYFQKATAMHGADHGRLSTPCKLFEIAVAYSIQLKHVEIDDASSNLITQNLAYTICGLHSFVKNRRDAALCKYWSALDSCERSCYLEALELLGSRKLKNAFLLSTDETSAKLVSKWPDHNDNLQSFLIVSLLKKFGKIAITKKDNQMKVVFNCYRIIMSQIGSVGCHDYAGHILEPVYKVCEGFSGKFISDEAKHYAEGVRDAIRKLLGNEYFMEVYNMSRKKFKEKRDKRRQGERMMETIDPERSAKRKLRISAKHRAHKKRKMMGLKMMRWRR